MFIVWGSRFYGKVDEVPGMFHVATKFGHLWYLPLIPMGSMVIVAKDGNSVRGAKIPLSAKSMFIAWGRALSIAGTLLVIPLVVAAFDTSRPTDPQFRIIAVGAFLAMVVVMVLLWSLKAIRRASYERALRLGELIGMSDEGRILMELHFGRITQADAKLHLESAAADRAEMKRLQAEIDESQPIQR